MQRHRVGNGHRLLGRLAQIANLVAAGRPGHGDEPIYEHSHQPSFKSNTPRLRARWRKVFSADDGRCSREFTCKDGPLSAGESGEVNVQNVDAPGPQQFSQLEKAAERSRRADLRRKSQPFNVGSSNHAHFRASGEISSASGHTNVTTAPASWKPAASWRTCSSTPPIATLFTNSAMRRPATGINVARLEVGGTFVLDASAPSGLGSSTSGAPVGEPATTPARRLVSVLAGSRAMVESCCPPTAFRLRRRGRAESQAYPVAPRGVRDERPAERRDGERWRPFGR